MSLRRLSRPDLCARIAVLWSEPSRRAKAERAIQAGQIYHFTGADGAPKRWLKGEYAYLGPNTLDAVLNRFNLKHDLVDDSSLRGNLEQYDLIFLAGAEALEPGLIRAIEGWFGVPGRFLVVSGPTNLPSAWLGLDRMSTYDPEGYTAWRWLPGSPFADRERWEPFYVSGYRSHRTYLAVANPDARVLAQQVTVSGDLASPASATLSDLGPAIVATNNSLFIANQPFEYLGGAFQAHLNVEEVRPWFHVTHWAETLLFQLGRILKDAGPPWLWETRLRTFGSHTGALVLRHDNDACEELAMLEYEVDEGIPATWLLLDSAFAPDGCGRDGDRAWAERVGQHEFLEAGLHNDSLTGSPPTWLTGPNLLRHVRESEHNLGIPIYSCGRHGGYSVYPEMIDAMDFLFDRQPQLLGLGTFCFHYMTEYGDAREGAVVDGHPVTYATATDPTIATPGFWFPFHAVVATLEGTYPLRGWDMTHDSDLPPESIDRIYNRFNSRDADPSTQLEDAAIQLQYHPLFARDTAYNNGRGTQEWLEHAVEEARRRGLWLASQRVLYQRMQDFQDLEFRSSRDGRTVELHNPTGRTISGLMIEQRSGRQAIRCGPHLLAHIVAGRFCTIRPLPPGGRSRLKHERTSALYPQVRQPESVGLRFVDCTFSPAVGQLDVQLQVLRAQTLLTEGWPPEGQVAVRLGGVSQGVMRADPAGRLALDLQGPTDSFASLSARLQLG